MSRCLRALAALASLLLVSGLCVGVTAAPAQATATLLCRGYDACARAGMPNAGYKARRSTMWWRMFPGHNCTNYAAYRMVRAGMPNVRPWSGEGNASNWGHAKPRRTNSVPRVGAVAWWGANVRPAGSSGHVAYVEKVLSPTRIVVSQDNWGGDFEWKRITRVGGSWPSGFIHFHDVPLSNTVRPTVSGATKVGSVLTASTGSWTPSPATFAYQWRADGVDIADANDATLLLTPAEEGEQISVRVTASKLGYPTTTATSTKTVAVDSGVLRSHSRPTVAGAAAVGSTLTASPGRWTPEPDRLAYQWTADGAPIPGATTRRLTPDPGLMGKALAVTVTATRNGYADVSTTSAKSAPVAPGTITATAPPTMTGLARPGETLTLDPGAFSPADAEVSAQWRRAGVPVEGATGPTYLITRADLGSRIGARVTVTEPGYTTLTTPTPPTRRVRSASVLRVQTVPGPGRLRVTATVRAAGVTPVEGTVRVRSHGSVLKELTLRAGTATGTLRGLPRGTRTFRVRYAGSRTATAAAVVRTVRIG